VTLDRQVRSAAPGASETGMARTGMTWTGMARTGAIRSAAEIGRNDARAICRPVRGNGPWGGHSGLRWAGTRGTSPEGRHT
jgi:hypothetical protein